MVFDINACRKEFEDLSGVIQWAEVVNTGSNEIFRLFVRDLNGTKAAFDKILKERIEPYFPTLLSYNYEKERSNGSIFAIRSSKSL